MRRIIKCTNCGKIKEHGVKNLCCKCYESKRYRNNNRKEYFKLQYKKYYGKPEVKERIKIYQIKKIYNLSLKEYKKIIEKCYLCGYNRTVDCHHLNGKKDNLRLIGLCPNHHRLLHINNLNQVELNKINNMR